MNYRSGGQGVVGSNPIVPTNKINKLKIVNLPSKSENPFRYRIRVQQISTIA